MSNKREVADAYMTVRYAVDRLAEDMSDDNPLKKYLHIPDLAHSKRRKSVKHATMLFSYNAGANTLGQRYFDALDGVKINGKYIFREASVSEKNAVGKLIYRSLEKEFPQVTKTRELIGNIAEAHQISGKNSIEWVNPVGFPFKQEYRIKGTKVVELPDGSGGVMKLTVSDTTDEVDWSKQYLGLAPNIIHSMDSAHKTLVTNRLKEKYGVRDFSNIHDSFATHAGNNTLMYEVTKEVFQEFYKDRNWLEELYNHFKKQGVPMLRYKRDANGRKIKKTIKKLFGGTEEVFETEPIPLSEIRDLGDYDFEDFDKLQYFFH